MPGNSIHSGPRSQLPSAVSKQDFRRRKWVSRAHWQGDYFQGKGSGTGEDSGLCQQPQVRGRMEKERRREDEQGQEHRAGWMLPEKGVDEHRR